MKLFFLTISILLHLLIFIKIDTLKSSTKKSSNYSIKVHLLSSTEAEIALPKKNKNKGSKQLGKQKKISQTKVISRNAPINSKDLSPKYPWRSKVLKEEGIVIVALDIHPDGRVDNIKIISSSGFDRLDKAAIESIKNLKVDKSQLSKTENKKITFNFKLD